MRIDPKNFELTPKVAQELYKNYYTLITFTDYFIGEQIYNRPLTDYFFRVLKDTVEDKTFETNERWEKTYLGRDKRGWEHVLCRIYKGSTSEYMQPGALHIEIHIRFKPIKHEYSLTSGLKNAIIAMLAMFVADIFFPNPKHKSTFFRDLVVGLGTLWGLNTYDKLKANKKRLQEHLDKKDELIGE